MNVEELLLQQNIMFKKAGQRFTIRCLSPEHEDRNPSMSIDSITGAMHCFSCGFGKGSTIFKHFGIANNMRDTRVLKVLKLISNIKAPEIQLPSGLIPFEGPFRNISNDAYKAHGAFTSFNEFKDRVAFPIRSPSGTLKAIISRHQHSNVGDRYIQYPANVFIPFYPLNPVVEHSSVIIVEGIFDYLNLYDKGVKNCIAIVGVDTSESRMQQIASTLALKHVTRIIIGTDNDDAGRSAANRLKDGLSKRFPLVEIINPADYGCDKDFGEATSSAVAKLKRDLYESSTSPEVPSKETVPVE